MTWGSDVSTSSHRFGPSAPRRSARSRTCWALSSPLTYSVRVGHAAASCSGAAGLATSRRHCARSDRRRGCDRLLDASQGFAARRPGCRPPRSASPWRWTHAEERSDVGSGPCPHLRPSSTPPRRTPPAPLRVGGGTRGAAIDETKLRHGAEKGCYTAPRTASLATARQSRAAASEGGTRCKPDLAEPWSSTTLVGQGASCEPSTTHDTLPFSTMPVPELILPGSCAAR